MIDRTYVERLRAEIELVASEIDEALIHLASPDAKREWASVRTRWRECSADPRFVDEDLSVVLKKVRRFGDILRHMKSQASPQA